MRQVVEGRLQRMLAQNPLRTDLQQHYKQIVAAYKREKDRVVSEQTFDDVSIVNTRKRST